MTQKPQEGNSKEQLFDLASKMLQLQQQRSVIKGKITRISSAITTALDTAYDIYEIEIRGRDLGKQYELYDQLQTQIDLMETDKAKKQANEEYRDSIEKKYYTTMGRVSRLLANKNETQKQQNKNAMVRLPLLELPVFAGEMREWPQFFNLFTTAMEGAAASPLQCLQYLKSALRGDAANLIGSLLITEENYPKALNILKDRYENKCLAINQHFKNFLQCSAINRNNLKDYITTIRQSLDSLTALQLPVEHWDDILVYLITDKLDNSLRAAWELSRKHNTLPTMNELLEFLQLRTTAFELISDRVPNRPQPSTSKYTPIKTVHHYSSNMKNNDHVTCILCNNDHLITKCPKFLALSIDKRIDIVKVNKLCFNCLQLYQDKHICSKKRCFHCNGKHHSLIHLTSPPKVSMSSTNNYPSFPTNNPNTIPKSNIHHTVIPQNHSEFQHHNIPNFQNTTQNPTSNIQNPIEPQTHTSLQTLQSTSTHLPHSQSTIIHTPTQSYNTSTHMLQPYTTNNSTNTQNINNLQSHIPQQTNTHNLQNISTIPSTVCVSNTTNKQMLLSTAIINVQDSSGNWIPARILLDSGSEVNIVAQRFADSLKCKYLHDSHILQGIGGTSGKRTHLCINTNIASRFNNYKANLNFIVMDKVTVPLPNTYINTHNWNISKRHYQLLADPTFYIPREIDMLIGIELFYNILLNQRINLGNNKPQLIETVFGWIVSGSFQNDNYTYNTSDSKKQYTSLHITNQPSSEDLLARFWQQEEPNPKLILTKEHKYCEQLFLNTTTQDKSGHYIVQMPTLTNKLHQLGNSFNIAYHSLIRLESKFHKDPHLYVQYKNFIHEFLELGHAELIKDFRYQETKLHCYLPHLGVLRPDSRSTKLRTVMNASSKTSTGISLNDVLLEGPNIYNDVLNIILRFRAYKYTFSCDIIKMFRTILVSEEQRPLLRLLWRDTPGDQLKCIQLRTVTYGTKCAPYLACRTLRHLADTYKDTYPEAAQIIDTESYMDDFLSGRNTIEETREACSQLINLLGKANFKLHKWSTSDKRILQDIVDIDNTTQVTTYEFNDSIKTLGIRWNTHNDTLSISVPDTRTFQHTKRNVLSAIAQIYDPLGILAPVVIRAKILMQDIWKEKLEWDTTLPDNLVQTWLSIYNDISCLTNITIDRYYFSDIPLHITLLGFSDASINAYGACIYLKATYPNKQPTSNLVIAKSRVAPIKQQSLPRLELCGALILAQIYSRVKSNFPFKLDKTYLFTDSMIVLHWIKSSHKKYPTYVSHRLIEIVELTNPEFWYYTNTKQNPADLLSRGLLPSKLKNNSLWWNGPSWILGDLQLKLNNSIPISIPGSEEEKVICQVSTTNNNSYFYDYFQKFSNFSKLTRVIAYIHRFIGRIRYNIKKNSNSLDLENQHTHLTALELKNAQIFIIKEIQFTHFQKEIKELRSGKKQSNLYTYKSSPLRFLNPFLDDNKIIRVGGRIHNADIPFEHSHPIILPSKEHVTSIIILQYHLKLLHSGIQNTLFNIRLKYWPLRGRAEVKKVIHRCIRCIRFGKAKTCEQQMSYLPHPRVNIFRPFTHVGVDFSGAILIRVSIGRSSRYVKGYICLFICLSTRAIHLELVSDLSTVSFINALKRLISRRGICQCIYSDNATNFKGANNELHDLYKMFKHKTSYSNIIDFCNSNNIQWKFTIPLASHMGGIYEAGIKSVKSLLKRYLGDTKVTYEMLYTILVQIEGILNSRPLYAQSDTPNNDIVCITPAHFLIGSPISDLPEPSLVDKIEHRLSLYQKIVQIKQKFWVQFYNNYLSELQPRTKWFETKDNLNIGDIVLLKDEASPPTSWPLGRVICIHKNNKDNLVRSVTIKTNKGEFMRPVNKLVLLPFAS